MRLDPHFGMLPERAFNRFHTTYEGGGKGDTYNDAPDYAGAAREQGNISKESIAQQTWANRPTQITPWGRTDYGTELGTDPSTGTSVTKWNQTESLNPIAQRALDEQLGIQSGRSQLAGEQMGRVRGSLGQEFNWGGLPAAAGSMEGAQREAYGRMQSFQAPERQATSDALDARLANQGLTAGSKAYETEHRRQADEFARQDMQNMQSSFGEGRSQGAFQNQLRQQGIAEEAQRRGMSLNEMNALLTGQQVQNPQMPGFAQGAAAQPANLLGAAGMQGQYALGQGQNNNASAGNLWGGVGSLAGAGASLYASGAFSDRRLKSNIERIGTHPLGIGIYTYDIFGHRDVGVMADEVLAVKPGAVMVHPSGFMMVNYGAL